MPFLGLDLLIDAQELGEDRCDHQVDVHDKQEELHVAEEELEAFFGQVLHPVHYQEALAEERAIENASHEGITALEDLGVRLGAAQSDDHDQLEQGHEARSRKHDARHDPLGRVVCVELGQSARV